MKFLKTGAKVPAFTLLTGSFALLLVVVVGGIGVVLWRASSLSIHAFGFNFLRTVKWDPVAGDLGALTYIWGTLYSSILALLIAAPIAIGIAIFLTDQCPGWLRQPLVFITELLAAIPSIVYGLWGMFVLVPYVRQFESSMPDWLRAWPIFSGPAMGVGMLAAALVLAIMVIPFTSSMAREVLTSVPSAQREGAFALGSTRWEATKVALYYARSGIIGAIMLGFGRALGETMAVMMVMGNTPKISLSMFAPQYTMSSVIVAEYTEAVEPLHISALAEVGLVLFGITLIVNMASRLLIWRMTREVTRPAPTAVVPAEASA